MRCYFIKAGQIVAAESLHGTNDDDVITQARDLFQQKGAPSGVDGFEIWDRDRFVFRFPAQQGDKP